MGNKNGKKASSSSSASDAPVDLQEGNFSLIATKDLKNLFKRFNSDGNDSLNRAEFEPFGLSVMDSNKIEPYQGLTKSEMVDLIFELIDTNRSGDVSYDEFVQFFKSTDSLEDRIYAQKKRKEQINAKIAYDDFKKKDALAREERCKTVPKDKILPYNAPYESQNNCADAMFKLNDDPEAQLKEFTNICDKYWFHTCQITHFIQNIKNKEVAIKVAELCHACLSNPEDYEDVPEQLQKSGLITREERELMNKKFHTKEPY